MHGAGAHRKSRTGSPERLSPAHAPPAEKTLVQPDVQADKLRIIGQMASSIAHELSNPLATIVASIQGILAFQQSTLASPEPGGNGGTQLRADLDLILAEARRAGDIVNGLLAFVREPSSDGHPASLQDALDRVKVIAQNHLKIYDISLHTPNSAREYTHLCLEHGSGQLQQILLNLIINAQQAITAENSSGNIFVTLWMEDADTAAIAVADDGPGIPPEIQTRIFEPFFTTRTDRGGTGLGLSICQDLIQRLGGSIEVTESPQGGACFIVRLPVVEDRDSGTAVAPGEKTTSTPSPAFECGHKVLLVDDEPGIVRSVGRYLSSLGYDVTSATSGEEAITALRHGSFDAVVSDLRMPGLSGEDLYALVQSEFPKLARRVVFASGDMMREETQQFLRQTGCLALQKPYELSELTDALDRLCTAAAAGAIQS